MSDKLQPSDAELDLIVLPDAANVPPIQTEFATQEALANADDSNKAHLQKGHELKERIRALKADNDHRESTIEMRKKYSENAFSYLCWLSGGVFFIIFLHGSKIGGFQLDTIVLTTLSGGTFVSAIGLFAFVIQGLFPTTKTRSKSKKRASLSTKKRT